MNKAWPRKKLEEVLVLNRSGYWGNDAASSTRPIPVLVIRNADITKHNSIKGAAPRFFSAKEVENAELQIGDIAMSSSGDVGKAWLVNKAGYSASNFIRILRPDSKVLLPSFLRSVLESDEGQSALASSTAGTTIQNLQKTFYSTLTIPLPPLAEQQRIVRLLDEAFEGIASARANAEKNLQNARRLFDNQLKSIFSNGGEGWSITTLSGVCSFDKKQGAHNGLPYVGLEDIESDTARFIGSMDPRKVKSATFKFSSDHVLYGRLRPYLNKVLAPEFDGHCSTEIFPLKPTPNIRKAFLKYWLLNSDTREKINASATGMRMPRANMNEVLAFRIAVPDLVSQDKIVDRLDALESMTRILSANYLKQLELLDHLKDSVLSQAFTGKLKAA